MDAATLEQLVSKGLSGSSFSLSSSSFAGAGDEVAQLLSRVFQQSALVLSNATVQTSGTATVLLGELASTPQPAYGVLTGFRTEAAFSLDAKASPQLHLRFSPPAASPWTILTHVAGFSSSLLGLFTSSGAVLELDSTAPSSLPASFPVDYDLPPLPSVPLATGMQLTETVAYTGSNSALSLLLGTAPFQVSGPLAMAGQAAAMDLAATVERSIQAGGFTLTFKPHLVSTLLQAPAAGQRPALTGSIGGIVVTGALQRAAGSTLQIPFHVVALDEPQHRIEVVGKFSEKATLALSDIAAFLDHDLAGQQPASFPALGNLSLTDVRLGIDPSGLSLLSAAVTVSYTPPAGSWPPDSDIISFNGLAVTFTVIYDGSSSIVETVIVATSKVGSGTIESEISLPSLDFFCELEAGSTLDITDLIDKITGGKPFGSLQMVCTDLAVLGNVAQREYTFRAAVQDNASGWSLPVTPDASLAISLTSVGINITYSNPDGKKAATTGSAFAQFLIAGAQLQLVATLPTDSHGWQFQGGTIGPQSIALSTLLTEVLHQFGVTIPTTAPDLIITDLQAVLLMSSGTEPMSFGFSCTTSLELLETLVDLEVVVGRSHEGGKSTTVFKGFLQVGHCTFQVDFTTAGSGTTLLFEWSDTTTPLTFETVAAFFGFTMPPLPGALDLSLSDAKFYYDTAAKTVAFSATSTHGNLAFVSMLSAAPTGQPGTRTYIFDLGLTLNVSFGQMPIIGPDLPPSLDVGIKTLQILHSNRALSDNDFNTASQLLSVLGAPALLVPALSEGFMFASALTVGGVAHPLALPLSGGAAQPATQGMGGTPATNDNDYGGSTKWFPIGKSLGPVTLARVGTQYTGGTLYFMLDASVSLAGLTLALDGANVSVDSKRISSLSAYHIGLQGLEISFSGESITVDGSLLRRTVNGVDVYDGEALLRFEEVTLAALGSYTTLPDGSSSLFVFAVLNKALGGPACFYVTGLAAGFGYNRSLKIPEQNDVASFPLVAGLSDSSQFGGDHPSPAAVLVKMDGWLQPQAGEYWLAVGVQFTTFKIINTNAILAVAFGNDLVITVLGVSILKQPLKGNTYVYAELDLEVLVRPRLGEIKASAVLADSSYVLTPDAHLTGGFAFSAWFGDSEHAGDFVYTMGGYHPAFAVPAHYPVEPRLGINWQIDSHLSLVGDAYFAITPAAMMAGVGLQLTFQDGDLKAWLDVSLDVLLYWSPFYLLADGSISVGVSYRVSLLFCHVTLSVEIGATFHLWGPPVGGSVHIDWYIISFTISFGADRIENDSLTWEQFKAMLPSKASAAPAAVKARSLLLETPDQVSAAYLHIEARAGLKSTNVLTASDGSTIEVWLVRPGSFQFSLGSAVPANRLAIANPSLTAPAALTNVGMRRVDGGVDSSHYLSTLSVAILEIPAAGDVGAIQSAQATSVGCNINPKSMPFADASAWAASVQNQSLPQALWGASALGDLDPARQTVLGTVGMIITPEAPGFNSGTPAMQIDQLFEDRAVNGGNETRMPLNPAGTAADNTPSSIASFADIALVNSGVAAASRSTVCEALAGFGFKGLHNGDLSRMAATASSDFADQPMEGSTVAA